MHEVKHLRSASPNDIGQRVIIRTGPHAGVYAWIIQADDSDITVVIDDVEDHETMDKENLLVVQTNHPSTHDFKTVKHVRCIITGLNKDLNGRFGTILENSHNREVFGHDDIDGGIDFRVDDEDDYNFVKRIGLKNLLLVTNEHSLRLPPPLSPHYRALSVLIKRIEKSGGKRTRREVIRNLRRHPRRSKRSR